MSEIQHASSQDEVPGRVEQHLSIEGQARCVACSGFDWREFFSELVTRCSTELDISTPRRHNANIEEGLLRHIMSSNDVARCSICDFLHYLDSPNANTYALET